MNGNIVFTSPGQFLYPRDVRLSDSYGVLRFFAADALTASPAGAGRMCGLFASVPFA